MSCSLSLTLASGLAIAASLGDARPLSHLGEPLRVEIPLLSEQRLDPDCIRIAPPETANDDIPWVRGARAAVNDLGGSQRRLLITTPRPVNTPVLMLSVHVACGIQIRREYALLLDPPGLAELATPTVEATPSPAPAREAEGKGLRRTQEGDSAASIAANLLPRRPSAQARLARAIVAANQPALGANASPTTPFPTNSLITIPELPPAAPATTTPAVPASDREPPPAAQSKARASRPQLRIASGPETGLQMSLSLGQYRELKENERDRLRTEMQLLSVLDEKIATQIELSDRLRRLEALQAQLSNDASRLEAELQRQGHSIPGGAMSAPTSGLEATPPAVAHTPSAPPPPSTQSVPPKQTAPVVVGEDGVLGNGWLTGALLLLALSLAGWLLWRRRNPPTQSLDVPADTAPAAAEPVAQDNMEELFEPLNEADIWPERDGSESGVLTPPPAASPRNVSAIEGALGPMSVASLGPASVLQIDDNVEEHDSAVELAEIMMSFGRVHGAAQTLADFIRGNPKQAVKPWIKLLEVYRAANMRPEFDALCAQLNKTFNVKPVGWEDFEGALKAPESLENLAHIAQKLCDTWGKRECQAYLHELLRDNRQGTRQGFALAIIDEILLLLAILEAQLGPYRPDDPAFPELEAAPPPAPETVRVVGSDSMIAPLDFSIEDGPQTRASNTAVDFDVEGLDLSKTLHINLDELDATETHESLDEFDSPKRPKY